MFSIQLELNIWEDTAIPFWLKNKSIPWQKDKIGIIEVHYTQFKSKSFHRARVICKTKLVQVRPKTLCIYEIEFKFKEIDMLNPNVLNKMSELELLVMGCGDSRVP